MVDPAEASPGAVVFKPWRPRWVRFVKAAARDLARDIYLTATKRGLDVGFAKPGSSTRCSSGSWTAGATPMADGSMTDVYSCFSGLLLHMDLSEGDAGRVSMMTYGLMKGRDLDLLPTTWRQLLQAALRMALLHQLKSESQAIQAAEKLQTLVELWHPSWQQDYDTFTQRASAFSLAAAAVSAVRDLHSAPTYRDSEKAFDLEVRKAEEGPDSDNLASI